MAHDLIEDIPLMARWRSAARAAALLPSLYSRALREEGPLEEREQMVWYAFGKEVGDIARTFGLPVGDAEEVCETFRACTLVLFGPDFRITVLSASEDSATIVMKGCPFCGMIRGSGGDEAVGFSWCLPYALSAVEALNSEFTLRFVRSRCMGDGQCEMTVQRREDGGGT
ncbi:hypothetical protein [Methanofollis fontis]|uniref:Metanogen output domain-containing protein n=1 Tax=Methanofollis fontis TaxID=2052832 RepID=A0A483CZS4_9EURY|nr:hypothetical protein [Methanofollis fontis]TAJ45669.1 hypothetical protein CUJ86_02840 [Methanofollis fontis]